MVFLTSLLLLLSCLVTCIATTSAEDTYLNVYGQSLHSCSSDGMALTGYTRTGYCVDEYDDQGSHHICIDLTSTTVSSSINNNNRDSFCTVTGQSDWCSSQDMPCHNDDKSNNNDNYNKDESCPIQNWCVCQWAFASYIQAAGGCDSIQTIVCDSINQQAVIAYQQQQQQEKYAIALQCIIDRCGLTDYSRDITAVWKASTSSNSENSSTVGSSSVRQTMSLLLLCMAIIVVSFVAIRRLSNIKLGDRNSPADDSYLLSTTATKTMT
jgi:hypothetical protein